MTTTQLRQHLAGMHRIPMSGGSPGILAARHDADHRAGLVEHVHDHDGEGDG